MNTSALYLPPVGPAPQVEAHPYHRNDALLAWCRERGVHLTAYSPLGSPDSASVFKRDAPVLLEDRELRSIAARLGRSPAQARSSACMGGGMAPCGRAAKECSAFGVRRGCLDLAW